jgi:hypothetical protein
MPSGSKNTWPVIERVDRSEDVTEGTIELRQGTLANMGNPPVVAVCCASRKGPVLRLRAIELPRLAAIVSRPDYARLGVAPAAPEIKLRPLTRGESMRRTASRMSLPTLAFVGVAAAVAGAIVPGAGVLLVIGASTAVPSAAGAVWKSRRDK